MEFRLRYIAVRFNSESSQTGVHNPREPKKKNKIYFTKEIDKVIVLNFGSFDSIRFLLK